MKTKILSTLREYSMTYPVRNSRALVFPNSNRTNKLNSRASVIQDALQIMASFNEIAWGFLFSNPRSIARTVNIST